MPQGSILGTLLFILLFNDITEVIRHSQIVKYADDTVIYFSDKEAKAIESHLSEDMDLISGWLKENELIINLKEGKTEALLFGTSKRISMQSASLKVHQGLNTIRNTNEYKYLGLYVNSSLNLNSHLEISYKKAAGRVKLLAKLRKHLDLHSARDVYCSMIMPVFTYCGALQIKLSEAKKKQLKVFHDRCVKIVYNGEKCNEGLPTVNNANKFRACYWYGNASTKISAKSLKIILLYKTKKKSPETPRTVLSCHSSRLNMLGNHFILLVPRYTTNYLWK